MWQNANLWGSPLGDHHPTLNSSMGFPAFSLEAGEKSQVTESTFNGRGRRVVAKRTTVCLVKLQRQPAHAGHLPGPRATPSASPWRQVLSSPPVYRRVTGRTMTPNLV